MKASREPFDPIAFMEQLSRGEQENAHVNLGRQGANYSVLPSLVNVTLFAWACNRGPFLGGVPHIDALHHQLALTLEAAGESIPLDITSYGNQQGGVLVVGVYDQTFHAYNWVTIVNVPNTGAGGPRGTLSYSRGLTPNPTTNGNAAWRFQGAGGQLLCDLFYSEDDGSANGLNFRFSGIPASTAGGPILTGNAVEVPG